MPCEWQGRLVFAPIWLVHEDEEMSTHKCWGGKNKVTEYTHTKKHIHRTDEQIWSFVKETKSSRLLPREHFPKTQGLDGVNNGKTSKFAENFCKPGLDIIFWYQKSVGLGRCNAYPHITSITEKHNNGMYFESFLRMNNRNRTYSSLLHMHHRHGAAQKVQSQCNS